MITKADPEFWEYLEGVDTPEQYDAFATFRDLGPRRRLTTVAQMHRVNYGTVSTWARYGSWKARCADFDVAQSAERDEVLAARRGQINAAWADRRAQLLEQLEDIASLGAEQLLANLKSNRQTMRFNELRLIVETVTKWQNLANGDATEKVDFGLDYTKLTDEQLAELEEIQKIAGSKPERDK